MELEFYLQPSGKSPVTDAIRALDVPSRAKVGAYLKTLEEQGHKLREPHVKPMGLSLMELRIPIVNGKYRVFYFFVTGTRIIALHAFQKKTQKTPDKEIELARKRMEDWKRRFL